VIQIIIQQPKELEMKQIDIHIKKIRSKSILDQYSTQKIVIIKELISFKSIIKRRKYQAMKYFSLHFIIINSITRTAFCITDKSNSKMKKLYHFHIN